MADTKFVHLDVPGSSFAPCGARISALSSTFENGKFTVNPNEKADLAALQSSTSLDMLDKCSCLDCRKFVRELYLSYQRGRRAKRIAW